MHAYATDGKFLAYVDLGKTHNSLPSFAIPADAIAKAVQVSNTSELKGSGWRITLPTEDHEVVAIRIQETAVKVRAGDAIDLMDWLMQVRTHHTEADTYIAFEPKALIDGLKKVSKLFINDKKFTNVLIIESNADGAITMTSEVSKSSFRMPTGQQAIDMASEYIHVFADTDAKYVLGEKDFRVQVDAKKFQNMVKDLAVSKPKYIQLNANSAVPSVDDDSTRELLNITATTSPLGFIAMPAKL